MTGSIRDLLVIQLARLRLACEALGIEPRDVNLADLADSERDRLVGRAALDLIVLLEPRSDRTARAQLADPDVDRAARFRELAGTRRAQRLRTAARLADASAKRSPQPQVPRGTKRDRSDQPERADPSACGVESRHHKVG
jgi:hypothetical protein